jgi:hypothetical protein
VPNGAELLAFVEAAHRATEAGAEPGAATDLDRARATVSDTIGSDGLSEAAATFAVFNGLVRVADGTGIQVDAGVLADSADFRPQLGVDHFAGASNTRTVPVAVERSSVNDLFA